MINVLFHKDFDLKYYILLIKRKGHELFTSNEEKNCPATIMSQRHFS